MPIDSCFSSARRGISAPSTFSRMNVATNAYAGAAAAALTWSHSWAALP